MGVDIHGHAGIGVAHEILKALQIHAGVSHVRAEGMPQDVGRDLRQRIVGVEPTVLLCCPLHVMLHVQGDIGFIILVQKQESFIAVDDPFSLGVCSAFENILQTFEDAVRHGDEATTTFGLGLLHVVLAATFPNQLMVDFNFAVFEI